MHEKAPQRYGFDQQLRSRSINLLIHFAHCIEQHFFILHRENTAWIIFLLQHFENIIFILVKEKSLLQTSLIGDKMQNTQLVNFRLPNYV